MKVIHQFLTPKVGKLCRISTWIVRNNDPRNINERRDYTYILEKVIENEDSTISIVFSNGEVNASKTTLNFVVDLKSNIIIDKTSLNLETLKPDGSLFVTQIRTVAVNSPSIPGFSKTSMINEKRIERIYDTQQKLIKIVSRIPDTETDDRLLKGIGEIVHNILESWRFVTIIATKHGDTKQLYKSAQYIGLVPILLPDNPFYQLEFRKENERITLDIGPTFSIDLVLNKINFSMEGEFYELLKVL